MNGNCDCLEKFKSGKLQLGTHITCNDPQMTEMIGNVGFDYFWIDTEHTVIGNDTLLLHLNPRGRPTRPQFVGILDDPVLSSLFWTCETGYLSVYHDAQEARRPIAPCLYPPSTPIRTRRATLLLDSPRSIHRNQKKF